MASAREKFNNKGGGVPSLFAYTINDTQKLGERRFPSKSKYIKNDITISKGIESRDTDLEGFGEVIKKVKKEDVQVPAGAIRKHKMVKQLSGRFNSEGKKKVFDIFALIDDAIDKEPTEEAKEKARERAAAKNAVNEPIPPRLVKKKTMPAQPSPPTLQTQSTEGDATTKAVDQAVTDGHVVDNTDAPIPTPASVPPMFTTSTSSSTPKREPAWKLRIQDKKQNTSTSTPVLRTEASSSDDVKEMEASPTKIPAQVVAPQQATTYSESSSSLAAVMKETDALKEEKLECKGDPIVVSPPHLAVTKDLDTLDEGKPDSIGVSSPEPASEDIDSPKDFKRDFKNAPAAAAVTTESKPTQKEPAWKLRLQDRQAASSSEIDASSRTSIDLAPNARIFPAGVENPPPKKEPAWKLRLQERQAASTIAEPVASAVTPVALIHHDVSMERGAILEGGKDDTQKNHQNEPPEGAPEDDEFSVSVSSVESDQSLNEQIPDRGVSHMETPEQVVVASSQMEPESSSSQDIKCDIEISTHLSEKSGGQRLDSYDEPKIYPVQHIECPVEDSTTPLEKHNNREQSIGSAGPLKAEPIRLPVTLGEYCADSDSDYSDSSSDDDMPFSKTLNGATKRKSDLAPDVTRLMQPPKLAIGSTASGIPLTEKVEALLARSLPVAPSSGTTTVTGSPSDKLEWFREQIKDTEKKIQATMIDAKLQVAELRKLFDDEKETMQEDFEERTREQRRLNLELDKKHEKLLNEEKKIVESLRAENKMLRANVDRLPKQMAETKQSIANLETANEEIATHTEGLLRFSKKLEADHEKLMESSRQCRDIYLPRYRTELRERQMALDTEIRIKTLYRDCAIKIAKHVAESSRKPDFVEEINALVLETEAEVNPKFDPRVLVASDSDSSSSSDSDDSSDSDSSSD